MIERAGETIHSASGNDTAPGAASPAEEAYQITEAADRSGLAVTPVVRRAQDAAVSAVRDLAVRYAGVDIPADVAQKIASAVLECADGDEWVSMDVMPDYWKMPDVVETIRMRLRHQLYASVADKQLLPTALPRETVQSGAQPWEPTTVRLSVPVRSAV